MKRCINIDWLEVYVLEPINKFPLDAEYFKKAGYKVKEREYGTPQYKEMFVVYENEKPAFEIRRNPYSIKQNGGIFDKRGCHVRLSNEICYDRAPIDKLRQFLCAHDYQYQNITRIDICLDFNHFDNNSDVQEFINKYMRGEISKVNQPRLSAHGTDKWIGRIINSLKWGSESSPNTTKLYNKSLELRQEKDKPYIRQAWADSGLDLSHDIWRIEYSMTGQFQTLKNKKSGEILKKGLSAYDNRKKLMQQFAYLHNRYFDFRRVEYNTKGNLKPKYKCAKTETINYKFSDEIYTPSRNITQKEKPDQTLKILINRLDKMRFDYKINREYREAADTLLVYFTMTLENVKYERKKQYEQEIETDAETLRFMFPEYDRMLTEIEAYKKHMETEAKEKRYLNILMKKYGIIPMPTEAPF